MADLEKRNARLAYSKKKDAISEILYSVEKNSLTVEDSMQG